MALSDIKIRNAKPQAKPYKMLDGDNLFLHVHPNGGKYWRYRYSWLGKEKTLSLCDPLQHYYLRSTIGPKFYFI